MVGECSRHWRPRRGTNPRWVMLGSPGGAPRGRALLDYPKPKLPLMPARPAGRGPDQARRVLMPALVNTRRAASSARRRAASSSIRVSRRSLSSRCPSTMTWRTSRGVAQ